MHFDQVTDWQPDSEGAFQGAIGPEWGQGRAIYGGLLTAGAVRLMRHQMPADRPPVEVHTRYVGPLAPGPFTVRSEVLRAGRSLTQVQARISGSEGLATVVLATFASPRSSTIAIPTGRAPSRPPPGGLVDLPHLPGITPAFVAQVSMRWTDGAPPFTGAETALVGGWCRIAHTSLDGTAVALALLDCFPSPVLPLLDRPVPASTVSWTGWLHAPPAEGAGWWWYVEEPVAAADGTAVSTGRLFAPDGQLAATKSQLTAVYA